MLSKIQSLLKSKDSDGLKDYLGGLKPTEKGKAFEQFLELLYNGNGYAAVRQGGRGDLGADIVLYDSKKESVYCIIQAKNQSTRLTFEDTVSELNKFESKASKKHQCREFEIVSINGFVSEAYRLSRFRLNLRDWQYVEGLIRTYDPTKPNQPVIRLHSHNQSTFDAVMGALNGDKRASCIQATGTGKSYVIAKTMSQFPRDKKLVIAPSHYILNQQKSVAPWLNSTSKYVTYSSAANLKSADLKKLNPSLIVLDEFHRVGADIWGKGVERILGACPDAKVLGTSATPIRYLDGERDMSEELFDEEAVNLSLAEAIQRNILPSPNYIASLYTLNEEADNLLDELNKSALADEEKIKIKREIEQSKIDWEKSSGVSEVLKKYLSKKTHHKFIVFCKDKKHLDELEDEIRKWIRKTGLFEDRQTYRVYSGFKKSKANLEAFLQAKDKKTAHILMAVDMLNEGIHAPDVGAVLLFRPTESPRIFYQQIGRCLQVGSDAEPTIFDFVNNFQSIRAGDFLSDLQKAGQKEKERREDVGLRDGYLPHLHVHDECLRILKTFRAIEDRLGGWEIRFKELVAYKQEHGDCLVPITWRQNKQLAIWVVGQRAGKKSGKLDADKITRLDELGFVWDPHDQAWEARFKELVAYKQEYSDCLVPISWKNKQLAVWVFTQRRIKRTATLPSDKIERLDALGFVWTPVEQVWEERFRELAAYRQRHGDCLVPYTLANKQLATWVTTQRGHRDKLSMEKIKRLDALGFVWDPVDQSWEERFSELVAYKKKYGDCLVSSSWKNKQLARWVVKQRAKRGALSSDKIKRLNALRFVWDPDEEFWEERFRELVAYRQKHGDCLVSRSWKNKQLFSWVVNRRARRGTLSSDEIKRLDALGFVWDADKQRWEERFKELVAYKKEHGDCMVPQKWRNNKPLASWVGTQRQSKRKATLPSDKIKRLDALGFVWDPGEQVWEQRFRELVAHKKKHGDCLVPQKWTNKQLGSWVNTQRLSKRKSTLPSDKIKRLAALGFVWDPIEQTWEERFRELVAYKKEHGDCLVPITWKNKQLALWVFNQRRSKRKATLPSDKIERLHALGFVWDIRK